ncbi:MAG TPA: branched-chain amino acid ABC transporter permease [Dehalococcoidia bacterium]|nr:branched-chain amino acid ABC transporter permease [Dehalococcoidia bacterium]
MTAIARARAFALSGWQELRYRADALGGALLWALVLSFLVGAAVSSPDHFAVGLVVGSVYALAALGLTLVYGVLRFANFAHGDLMMLGAYLAYFVLTGAVVGTRRDVHLPRALDSLPGASERLGDLTFGYGLLLATLLAALALALLCIGLDRLVYRPLRRRRAGVVVLAVASLGLAIGLRSLMLMLWGPNPRLYVEGVFPARSFPFGVLLKTDQVFTFGLALGLAALVYLLLFRTRLGKAMRAMADNPDLARVSGIDTDRVTTATWALAGALMAVAGVLLALQAQLNPQLGFVVLLPVFAGAILGGIGNPVGALLGAMVVAMAQETSVGWEIFGRQLDPTYKPGVAFVILIAILLLRPRGLLGART